jgi:formylglycine-generating enzyme required for sulfatase activity
MLTDTREDARDGALMVRVPAGPFLMGVPDADFLAEPHEKPCREVTLSAYWIDVYPVTNARYRRFLSDGGYDRSEFWTPLGWAWRSRSGVTAPLMWAEAGWDGPDQPVAGVSWFEADAYARWAGRRLPTDAEWEKAARGTDGRRYPWGDDWPVATLANFDGAVGRTTPVGLYPDGVSPYGCHDMAGNVNNWTADWYWEEFGHFCVRQQMLRNPQLHDRLRQHIGKNLIGEKVDRGGGFGTDRTWHEVLGCTRKVHTPPMTREPWNGFRTARDAGDS